MMPGEPLDLKTALEFPCGKDAGVDFVSRLRRFLSRVAPVLCDEKAIKQKPGEGRP